MTQLEVARSGRVSAEMERVAHAESEEAAEVRKRIRDGLLVVPANRNHEGLSPVGIGLGLRTKVNANIGTSPPRCSVEAELEKLRAALDARADTVMDLSIGGDLDEVRRAIMEHCSVPLGTVPIYQAAIESGGPDAMSIESYLDVFEKHAEDGVDFATVHAGVTREAVPLLEKRVMGVVSRGGAFLIKWMMKHGKENFLYEHFDSILDIAREHDVTLSLGDGLRPGCIADATDEAQIHELKTLGELARRARERGVQVMIEGPGHIPLHQIEQNVRLEKEYCDRAPFYVLGPLPTDVGCGYDHIVGAIGGALAALAGADFLCYLTPKEHIGLPDAADVREGVVVTRIAAHIGDVAKGIKGARELDRQMSEARGNRDWQGMLEFALDPVRFGMLLQSEERGDQCSMCGEYCAIKVFRDAVDK
jgi:phosphomethylpyrimidine synthase